MRRKRKKHQVAVTSVKIFSSLAYSDSLRVCFFSCVRRRRRRGGERENEEI
jgi:hypothetical protein